MSQVSVPYPTASFLRLAAFLKANGSDRDPISVIEDAVEYWLENAPWKKQDLLGAMVEDSARGYTWKSLFLPSGTTARIKTKSGYQYARVEGDFLIYNGERMSPNQFALSATGSERDAWRDVWIKRPTDADYIRADDLRE